MQMYPSVSDLDMHHRNWVFCPSTPAHSAQLIQVLLCRDDRLNELRLLKLKLGESRRELHILKNSVANIDILKHEVHCLGRELLQERTKVKALSEELENPLNVHRCETCVLIVSS